MEKVLLISLMVLYVHITAVRCIEVPLPTNNLHHIVSEEIVMPINIQQTFGPQMLDDQASSNEDTAEDIVFKDGIDPYTLPPEANGSSRRKRKIQGAVWPGRRVPYVISTQYSRSEKAQIEQAIKWWKDYTCIDITPKTSRDTVYLSFEHQSNKGCSSYLGFTKSVTDLSNGKQTILLNKNSCFRATGIIAHEIGHALGLVHEQARGDRDEHVSIYPDRIEPDKLHNYVVGHGQRALNTVPYDLASVMHYSPNTFAKYRNLLPTMTALNGKKDGLMGQRAQLGYYDIKGVNEEYKCGDTCNSGCLNEGYALKKNNKCECLCAEGLTGNRCQQVSTSCGGIISLRAGEQRTLTSPNYPRKYGRQKCVWVITAPINYIVEVDFEKMSVPKKTPVLCAHTIEIRNNLLGQRGDIICGDGAYGPVDTRLDHKNRHMMIVLDGTDSSATGGSFQAKIRAKTDACLKEQCQNGATCEPIGSTGFRCICLQGYVGQRCEKVTDAAVNCDFAMGFCNWKNDESDDLDFARKLESRKFREYVTHETNENRFFIASPIEYKNARHAEFARFKSPMIAGSRTVPNRCLEFSYNMGGKYMTQAHMRVVLKDKSGKRSLWTKNGRQSGGWLDAKIEITNVNDFEVYFEMETNDNSEYTSLMAIDDVKLMPQSCTRSPCDRNPCHAAGSQCVEESSSAYRCLCAAGWQGSQCDVYDTSGFICNFDNPDLCGWTNDATNHFDWRQAYLKADPFLRTGPAHGSGGQGYYLLTDTSTNRVGPGKISRITSPNLDFRGDLCVKFDYHMYGPRGNMGSLSLMLKADGRLQNSKLWTKSGVQGSEWNSAAVEINSQRHRTQVVFEREGGQKHASDIALDNIQIEKGRCRNSQKPPTGRQSTAAPRRTTPREVIQPSRAPSNAPRVSRKLVVGDVMAECNFESNLCADTLIDLASENKNKWIRTNRQTPSTGTGPTAASEGQYYIFMEASSIQKSDTSRISTNILLNSLTKACLRFDYHMHGENTGQLNVYTKGESRREQKQWGIQGEKMVSSSTRWATVAVNIDMNGWTQVIIEGVRGDGYRSDIALDNIKLVKGACNNRPAPAATAQSSRTQQPTKFSYSCAFEGGHTCAFIQDNRDRFDWTVHSGSTQSDGTGPSSAYRGSKYLYVEGSDPRQNNDQAALVSPSVRGDACVSMAYHMFGDGSGSLTVYQLTNSGRRIQIHRISGQQGNRWKTLRASISNNNQNYKVVIEAKLGSPSYRSDMAIDEVAVKSGRC